MHDRPLRDLLAAMDAWYDRLAALSASLPDDDILTPGRYDLLDGQPLIAADFFGHFHEEHEATVRTWLQSR